MSSLFNANEFSGEYRQIQLHITQNLRMPARNTFLFIFTSQQKNSDQIRQKYE